MTLPAVGGRHAETKITGTAYGGCENNEWSPFNFGLSHLNHGDCSPLFLYQNKHASMACERLANFFSAISRSIQSIRSWSIVTLIRGLLADIQYDYRTSKNINTPNTNAVLIGLNPIGVRTNERSTAASGCYRRLAEGRIEEGC